MNKVKETEKIIAKIREVSADLNDLYDRPAKEWGVGQLKHEAKKLDKSADELYQLHVHGNGTGTEGAE